MVDSDTSQNMSYTIRAYDASCPKREISPCGVTKTDSMSSNGEDIWQIAVPADMHLIVDMDTTEFHSDLYIKYGKIPEQNPATDDDYDEGSYDAQSEPVLMKIKEQS